jgi:hypothetical protein
MVLEQKLGRPIRLGYEAHHIDGNKLNNHPDNLMEIKASEHRRLERLGKKVRRWLDSDIALALHLYRSGHVAKDVAFVIGRPFHSTYMHLSRRTQMRSRNQSLALKRSGKVAPTPDAMVIGRAEIHSQ